MILSLCLFGFGFKKLVEQRKQRKEKNTVVTDNERGKKGWRTNTRGGVQ
jgi:hypothetical protein